VQQWYHGGLTIRSSYSSLSRQCLTGRSLFVVAFHSFFVSLLLKIRICCIRMLEYLDYHNHFCTLVSGSLKNHSSICGVELWPTTWICSTNSVDTGEESGETSVWRCRSDFLSNGFRLFTVNVELSLPAHLPVKKHNPRNINHPTNKYFKHHELIQIV